jgi:phage head maturation protease
MSREPLSENRMRRHGIYHTAATLHTPLIKLNHLDSPAGYSCARCRAPIAAVIGHETIGDSTYHPSCAAIVRARMANHARPAAAARPRERVIGTIAGIAVTFDSAGCVIFSKDGTDHHERFLPGCFDRSIATGPYTLNINHGSPIRGRWDRVWSDAAHPTKPNHWLAYPVLRFRFHVYDSTLGREVVEGVGRGAMRHCSISFSAGDNWRYGRNGAMKEIIEARLNHIGVLESDRRPAWCETACWLE